MEDECLLRLARRIIREEAEAVRGLLDQVDQEFVRAVRTILSAKGLVAVIGVGKSGLIGRKVAATLASTGTPAVFVHAAEAAHGDLGVVSAADVVLLVSNSGETPEILGLLPYLRAMGTQIIALVGREDSTLVRQSDVAITARVPKEADPLGLVPTCSAVAALVMGDALAVALLETRGFTAANFVRYHPGGSLGRMLQDSAERG